MTNRLFIILWVVSVFFTGGCMKSKDQEEQRYTWSTEAPLTIPYRTRLQRFERGNVIRNPSFETGRTFTLSSSASSFVIDGWQQIGQQVQWVDTRKDSLFARDETFSGYRSVKITRKNAYETDEQGDGIMSEFIKVIPGNYTLSLYTRLENIHPPKARLGIKMYDAIDVQLVYFDRNKIAISPNQKYPGKDQFINTSFKSLSFANYDQIASLGWGKIIGKSAHFPFPDGDIPSNAHYVKIFIGLKGTGTLWIDSIHFSYSDCNFSVNERMRIYTDTSYSPIEAIVPTPKHYRKLESVIFQSPGITGEQQPLIILPSYPDVLIDKAAGLLQDALGISDSRVIRETDPVELEKSKLVFSLGATGVFRQYQAGLPENAILQHPQGYYIYSPAKMPHFVFLGGNNSTGIYYAVMTVLQMIDKRQPVYHNARIIDYPDFTNRFVAMKDHPGAPENQQGGLAEELTRYKLNGALSATQPTLHNQLLDSAGFEKRYPGHRIGPEFYSGSSWFSIRTDHADIDRYISYSGIKPVFMDNSMQISAVTAQSAGNDPGTAGKIRLYNLFEPYGNTEIREHFSKLDTATFFINLAAGSEIDVIRLATAADFMWNAAAYSGDHSLWKVLQARYGADASRKLIHYADKYSLMLEVLFKLKITSQVPRNLKNEQQILAELNLLVAEIGQMLGPDHRLVKELRALNGALKEELNRFASKIMP